MKRTIIGFAVMIVLMFFFGGCTSRTPPFPPKNLSDIACIEAFIEKGEVRFEILPEDYERVLRLFEKSEIEKPPRAAWVVFGSVLVTDREGRTVDILLFQTYENVGAYKIGDRSLRGSKDEAIRTTLIECAQRAGAIKK